MTIVNRSVLLPYDAHQLFALVSDVEAYPSFMEGCVGAEVLHRAENLLEARLDLAKGGIKQSFSTRNRMVAAQEITLELIDGPFDNFAGRWDFRVLGDSACKMSLILEFSFNNSVLGAAASHLFEKVTSNLVDAIETRARQVYG